MRVMFVTEEGVTEHIINEHASKAYKFLYWSEQDLLLVSDNFCREHREIAEKAGSLIPSTDPDAGGVVWNGKIRQWFSAGYNVETSEELKPLLAEAMGIEDGSWE